MTDSLPVEPCLTMLDIMGYVGAEPFQPFRFRLNDGRTLDVRSSEAVQVGKSVVSVSPTIARLSGFHAWESHLAVSSIFAIEPIE